MIAGAGHDLYEKGRRILSAGPLFGGAPSISMVVVDNGDASGGAIDITGATGDTVTSVYYAPFDGTMKTYSFSLAGTVTGNGTLFLNSPSPFPLGFYLWQAVSTTGGATTVLTAHQNLSDQTTEEARHMLILDCVVARIQLLNLQDIASGQVYNRWRPRLLPGVETSPSVCVSPVGNVTRPGVLSNRDDIGWPIEVNVRAPQQADNKANENRNLLWTQKIDQALRNQRLPGAPQVYILLPEVENAAFDLSAFDKNYWSCALRYRAVTREIRGLS